jgi:hypothetical protein
LKILLIVIDVSNIQGYRCTKIIKKFKESNARLDLDKTVFGYTEQLILAQIDKMDKFLNFKFTIK